MTLQCNPLWTKAHFVTAGKGHGIFALVNVTNESYTLHFIAILDHYASYMNPNENSATV